MKALRLAVTGKEYEELKYIYRKLSQEDQEMVIAHPLWNLMDVLHQEVDILKLESGTKKIFYDRDLNRLLAPANRKPKSGDIAYIHKSSHSVDDTYVGRAYHVEVGKNGVVYLAAKDTFGEVGNYTLRLIPEQYLVLDYV